MRYRQSGMPVEDTWENFFSPKEILVQLEVNASIKNYMEIGCGYGTFLFPASDLVSNKAIGIDIDNDMIDVCKSKILQQQKNNIELILGDITESEIQNKIKEFEPIDFVGLFNILHCENPINLLQVVYDVIASNGKLGIIHWNYENTPRGPSLDIRPKKESIIEWCQSVGFELTGTFDFRPYHFGLLFKKR
jgi:SAM-dependent methyltransferase